MSSIFGSILGNVLGGLLGGKKQNQAQKQATEQSAEQFRLAKEEYTRQQELLQEWNKTFGFIDENIAQFAKSLNSSDILQYKTTLTEQAYKKAYDNTMNLLAARGYDVSNGIEAGLLSQVEQQKQLALAELQVTVPQEVNQQLMTIGQYAYTHRPNPAGLFGVMNSATAQVSTALTNEAKLYGQQAKGAAMFGGQLAGAVTPVIRDWFPTTTGNILFGTPPPQPTTVPRYSGFGVLGAL